MQLFEWRQVASLQCIKVGFFLSSSSAKGKSLDWAVQKSKKQEKLLHFLQFEEGLLLLLFYVIPCPCAFLPFASLF